MRTRILGSSQLLLLLALVWSVACAGPKDNRVVTGENTQKLVLAGGTLIDGTGRAPVQGAAIVIDGKRIQSVTDVQSLGNLPVDAKIIRVDGKFVLPGLWDGHVHYQGWAAPLYLSNGITTVLDTANVTPWILAQEWAVANRLVPGPRILTSGGQIDSPPSTFDWAIRVSTAQEAREAVRQHAQRGVDFIKTYTMLERNLLKAVIDEAHALGLPVRGHLTISAKDAAELGIDCIEHLSGIPIATMDNPEILKEIEKRRREPDYLVSRPSLSGLAFYMEPERFHDLISLLVKKKTFIAPTLVAYWIGVHTHNKEYEQENHVFATDPRNAFIPQWSREGMLMQYPTFMRHMSDPRLKIGYENTQKFIKAFVDAGGKIIAGSDPSLLSAHGIDLHRELELLVDAGLSPMQVLQAATINAAQLVHKDKDLGTIEPGKLADLIVVNGNPLQNIRNTRKIQLVIQEGRLLDRNYDSSFLDAIPRPLSKEQQERYQQRTFGK